MSKMLSKVGIALIAGLAVFGSNVIAPAAEAATYPRLSGKWTAVLSGNTGCGATSMYVTFSLNSLGTGPATLTSHSTGCPNGTSAETMTIFSLDGTGQGTAGLTCGASCGFSLRFQVSSDFNQMIITDVDAGNPNNTPTGAAIRQFP